MDGQSVDFSSSSPSSSSSSGRSGCEPVPAPAAGLSAAAALVPPASAEDSDEVVDVAAVALPDEIFDESPAAASESGAEESESGSEHEPEHESEPESPRLPSRSPAVRGRTATSSPVSPDLQNHLAITDATNHVAKISARMSSVHGALARCRQGRVLEARRCLI